MLVQDPIGFPRPNGQHLNPAGIDHTAGLEEFGVVLEAAKNEANERLVGSGRVKIMVVPTNEELAIARDTRRILSSLAPRPAEAAPAPPVRPAAFGRDDIAALLLVWAKDRKAGAAALAAKWGRAIGRSVAEADVARELKRLGLADAPPRPAARKKT